MTCLRTDRGGEFNSKDFQEYCTHEGIKRQLTAAYTPQQNGVAERKNRSVMNMVRCMLFGMSVPLRFWPEAVQYAVHILNRSPTSILGDVTPSEKWSKNKPSVEHLRVFGCVAFALIPYERRVKLDEKSIKCVMFGVSKESKAYRLYDPLTKKIIISRDVKFDEKKPWNWNEEIEDDKFVEVFEEEEQEKLVNPGEEAHENSQETREEEEINDEQEEETSDVEVQSKNAGPAAVVAGGKKSGAGRAIQKPVWMKDYECKSMGLFMEVDGEELVAFYVAEDDPQTFEDAIKHDKWRKAMEAEINSIEENDTWEPVELPKGAKVIGVKWVYKTKLNERGEVDKFKARLVAKGFHQTHGVDFHEVFAPVARWDTIRCILALAAQEGWNVFQLDVKSAFLHGELKEDVYVEQPEGFELRGGDNTNVYKLKRALYGLRQAPRAWYSRIESYFMREGFKKCYCEHTLFVKTEGVNVLIVSLYVDDLIYTSNSEAILVSFKSSMMMEFSMTDLGRMKYFLGVEVTQDEQGIFISQKKYAMETLNKFGMEDCNPVKNPTVPGCKLTREGAGELVNPTLFKKLVGSLRYLTATRPDLIYSVNLVSRFMESPTEQHMLAAKRILRYIQGTTGFGIQYRREYGAKEKLVGYVDSDYAGDEDDRRSTSGYTFMIGNGAVSWASKKQSIVTLSTTEAEFVAAANGACQAMWLRNILTEVGFDQGSGTTLFCDNSSTIKLSKNPVLHGRSKHIHVRYHFLRDLVNEGVIELEFCRTQDQVSDIMTKPVKLEVFEKLRGKMGVGMKEE
ncbi:Retrovirus-related Pol polyprotein from transposon TNT 1-94 [Cardamine amara subsp. amara]|uniref:Retrovirus-related Pol polyprotein from transposon TNT 1-94 n=1 Tax=Cardamine amara subsp. amara TaxID=228776 RepID=A0ABD1BMD3_CARAN